MSGGEALAAMTAAASRHPTGTLCDALVILDRKAQLDDAERAARAVFIDVLCGRHPEADEAFTAWAESDDHSAHGAVDAIVTAARAASRT